MKKERFRNLINPLELKVAMVRKNLTVKDLAKAFGCCEAGVRFKIRGKRDFTYSELMVLHEKLNLSGEDFLNVFFTDIVAKEAPKMLK